MRLGWAIVSGVVIGALVVWWLGRSGNEAAGPDAPAAAASGNPASGKPRGDASPALYRWRDDAGVLQLTDTPPRGRPFDTVDIDDLQRRNTFDPRPGATAPD